MVFLFDINSMKSVTFFLFLHLLFCINISYADTSISLDAPPASLEKWYKPTNKRQVWLHTMFKLRREMQAIKEYSAKGHFSKIPKWIERLDKDYNKISDMVPEWENELKPRLISELEMFVEKSDSARIAKTLNMIRRTCDDCHKKYQPLVTALYRTPHYDDIKIINARNIPQEFEDNMADLSESVNRVLIALDDNHNKLALKASQDLDIQLQSLGKSCTSCHKDDPYPRERILGKATQLRINTLQKYIREEQVKDSKKLMGEIAVTVCARCHNTHRIIHDLRKVLIPDK